MNVNRYNAMDDETLVLGAVYGSLPAFDELVRRYRRAVYRVAEQVVGAGEAAEDVTQEAFLLAFRALPQLQSPAKFAGWLCAIARNCSFSARARARRHAPTEPDELDRLLLAQSVELSQHPAAEYARKEEFALVREALCRLPGDYRLVLQLHYFDEWTVTRIGAFLSIPVTTVKWRLRQGRRLLYRQLKHLAQEETE